MNPDSALIDQLKIRIASVLTEAIPQQSPVALLNYPNHSNVGDCAIWLGEEAFFADHSYTIADRSDIHTFSASRIRKAIGGNGTVVLHGGGNFGDIWPVHQRFREKVIRSLPGNRIVVLPQTVHFTSERSLHQTQEAISGHGGVTLIARDSPSLATLTGLADCEVALSPDMAFCLGPMQRTTAPDRAICYLARTDLEADEAQQNSMDLAPSDWIATSRRDFSLSEWLGYRSLKRLTGLAQRSHAPEIFGPINSRLFRQVASSHLRRGLALLGSAETVITDRLHGHILCLLLGIPHFVLDNTYGKLTAFRDTWTKSSVLASSARDAKTARQLAMEASRGH